MRVWRIGSALIRKYRTKRTINCIVVCYSGKVIVDEI